MRLFNLDDDKNSIEITVGGTTFHIRKVVLAVQMLYGEYLKASAGFMEAVKSGDISDTDAEGIDEYVTKKVGLIDAMMDRILSKNGYAYDKEWWADNVESYHDIELFVVRCLNKDNEDKKKETPERENSTTTD